MKASILLIIAIITIPVKAQFRETSGSMSKGMQKGILMQMDTIDKSIAFGAVNKTISDKDHLASSSYISFNELFFDNVKIPGISDEAIDFYAKFHDSDKSLTLFIDLGAAFIDSSSYPKQFTAFQQLCLEIRHQVWNINRQNDIDSLKRKIKQIDDSLTWVASALKSTENSIKANSKVAAKDDKSVQESELILSDANAQIRAVDSLIIEKKKVFDAFPLEHLKTINGSKNKALEKNRSTRQKLINKNTRSREKIAEYETEILLNKSSLNVLKGNEKETKKLNKANQKLNTGISEEQLNITLNDASISTINGVIKSDSIILKKNMDSLSVFDEDGKRKELKQLENRKTKLLEKSNKSQQNIEVNKLESEQKKKDVETGTAKVRELTVTQDRLKRKKAASGIELSNLEKQQPPPVKSGR